MFPGPLRLEDEFRDLADRPVPARGLSDDPRRSLDLGHGVGDGDWQPDASEQGEIGEIVTHERALPEIKPTPLEDLRERRKLLVRGPLHQVVHPELLGAGRRGWRDPPAHENDQDARRLEELDPQAVLDVELFEFGGLVPERPEVEAAVGQDPVHIQADELDGMGAGSVQHHMPP